MGRAQAVPLMKWLVENFNQNDFSKSAGTWRWSYAGGKGKDNCDWLCFRYTKDYVLFKLVWAGQLDT